MKLITIIVPCLNEEESIPIFYKEIHKVISDSEQDFPDASFEILFIDDGSKDGTLKEIKNLRDKDNRVRYISFSRNFGKESAIYAGFENARGDYVVCMDVDMQDPPKLLKDMYRAVTVENYDSCATRRVTRKGEPPIRSFFARQFYKIMRKISDTEVMDGARDYRMMKREMADSILSMHEYSRFTKGIYGWVGYKTKWLEFENVERAAGETKWSFWGLFRYAIEGVLAFSTVPLELILWIGVIMSGLSFIALIVSCIFYSFWGFLPLIVSLIVFIGAMQTAFLGVISIYLAKTYLETKKRPIYIYKEKSE
ncbi:MAG: glycosyltransferase family 2 protein [Lachnospiraceae bacterium]|nr:glycosyltransferase family 2 protein [Lachnospiraceae bacterium]